MSEVSQLEGPHLPSRQVNEVLSWRLAAELLSRHPGEFRLIEAHNGGGQYDELWVYLHSHRRRRLRTLKVGQRATP